MKSSFMFSRARLPSRPRHRSLPRVTNWQPEVPRQQRAISFINRTRAGRDLGPPVHGASPDSPRPHAVPTAGARGLRSYRGCPWERQILQGPGGDALTPSLRSTNSPSLSSSDVVQNPGLFWEHAAAGAVSSWVSRTQGKRGPLRGGSRAAAFPTGRLKALTALLEPGLGESTPPTDTAGPSFAPSKPFLLFLRHSSQGSEQKHGQESQMRWPPATRRLRLRLQLRLRLRLRPHLGPFLARPNQLVLFPPPEKHC